MAIPAERVPGLHVHALPSVEVCEVCEQPIPPERIAEVRGRLAALELARTNEVTTRLREQFGRERAEDAIRFQAQLDAVREEGTVATERIREEGREREVAIRAEVAAAAEEVATKRLAEAQRTHLAENEQWQARLDQLASERSTVELTNSSLKDEIAQLHSEAQDAARVASEREEGIRAEAQRVAAQAMEERIAALIGEREARETQLQEQLVSVEAERQRAYESNAALAKDLQRERTERQTAVEAAQHEGELLAAAAREEATRVAQAEVLQAQQRAAAAEQQTEAVRQAAVSDKAAAVAELDARLEKTVEQRVELEKAHREVQQDLQTLKDQQATTLQNRLHEQRDALTAEKDKAILETEARTFAERQRLQTTVQDLTRQLEKMSAHERGEGAEIDLYEALKGAFEGDRIKRVKPGVAGPDIIHEIVRYGKVCGTIIYDSKNRNDYKSSYATKLRTDQMAAKAEFAVLSSNHFPANVRQLHLHEGVIVACPARVVTIAQMLRRHLIQLYDLRVSSEERGAKTERLYKFITSEQCHQLLESVEKLVDDLLELDVKEQSAHKTLWEKRGRMLTSVLKAHGDFCSAVDRIIGTAD